MQDTISVFGTLKRDPADSIHKGLNQWILAVGCRPHSIPFPASAIPDRRSAELLYFVRQKLRNKYTTYFKYLKRFQIYLEMSRGFLSGSWQYRSDLRALQAPSVQFWPVRI
jgi:hypothetical protein